MNTMLSRFAKDESGATAIEYGLIATLIGVAIIAAATTLGTKLNAIFTLHRRPSSPPPRKATKRRAQARRPRFALVWPASRACRLSGPHGSGRAASNTDLRTEPRDGPRSARFLRDCSGSTALEYAVIGSLVSIAMVLRRPPSAARAQRL